MKNNELMIRDFDGMNVRIVVDEKNEPWFVAKDVCDVLGLVNSRQAVSSLDDDEKITVTNPDGNPRAGIPHTCAYINESGLYGLILVSQKEKTK